MKRIPTVVVVAILTILLCLCAGLCFRQNSISDFILILNDQMVTDHLPLAKNERALDFGTVIYANVDIPAGKKLDSNDILARQVKPKNEIPRDALWTSALAIGKRARKSILKGEVIMCHSLLPFRDDYVRPEHAPNR